jgi:hypothetical protein
MGDFADRLAKYGTPAHIARVLGARSKGDGCLEGAVGCDGRVASTVCCV